MIKRMRWMWVVMVAVTVAVLSGCDGGGESGVGKEAKRAWVLEGKTMGTFWRVSVAGVDAGRQAALRQAVQGQLDADDRELSTWKSDSLLSRFNQYRGSEPWPVSNNMADIVTLALRIGEQTGGAMDITVGPLVNLWGFGPDKQPVKTPDALQIAAAKALTGLAHLQVINRAGQAYLQKDLPQLYVDLSTVGEGFATDHLARLLE